jgi:hypothetical protein
MTSKTFDLQVYGKYASILQKYYDAGKTQTPFIAVADPTNTIFGIIALQVGELLDLLNFNQPVTIELEYQPDAELETMQCMSLRGTYATPEEAQYYVDRLNKHYHAFIKSGAMLESLNE